LRGQVHPGIMCLLCRLIIGMPEVQLSVGPPINGNLQFASVFQEAPEA
jgi:hypothetical protein